MNHKHKKTTANLILSIALVAGAASCKQTNSKKAEETNSDSVEKVYPVRIQEIQVKTIPKTLEYTANLEAFKEIHYAPAMPGRVDKIYVDVGSRVRQGQLLVKMDKTQLNQALTQLDNAKTYFQRVDTLYKLESMSEQAYDQAKTQYELALSNVNYLKENTTLTSPIYGIVTGKYFENGEFYSGAPNTTAGKAAVISLMQINPLKAIVNITESYFPKVKKGMKAKVTSDIYPDQSFEGSVYKVHPTIDPNSRTFETEITINNKSEILRPGMFARIKIDFEEAEALVVPAISILKQEGTNNRYVFINENGFAKQIEVEIGNRFDDMVELKANGIKKGMQLIVEGQANLLNGSKIKVVEEQ